MQAHERMAAIAAYYMARFNCNLGCATTEDAFRKVETVTGVPRGTIRASMRDNFDYWFPHREGWDLKEEGKKRQWEESGLKDVYYQMNELGREQIKTMLVALGLWEKATPEK